MIRFRPGLAIRSPLAGCLALFLIGAHFLGFGSHLVPGEHALYPPGGLLGVLGVGETKQVAEVDLEVLVRNVAASSAMELEEG